MDESVWESMLMRFSPQQILCASFAGIFVLTLAFAYVVVDPTLSTRPYKNLSVQYTACFDDSTYTPPKDDELIKRCSLRDIDREIHLSQTQDTHATSSLHRRKHGMAWLRHGTIITSYTSRMHRPGTTATHPTSSRSTDAYVCDTFKNRSADCSHLLKQVAGIDVGAWVHAENVALSRGDVDRFEAGNEDEIKAPLQTMHDILTYFKAPPTRDINQVSIFCKALVKHDGLDLLQTLVQTSADPDVQAIAQAIIEEAVPSIWC
ncbi:hypothetical protein H310_00075 [Aphanomyces invadans]|uniref:Uncharacterized protein n=1 Tax=Aphanomyces invadans TaxID=157072 RepID=A0A024UV45_9STRA|nr:hypothetical protein H310_00075 [Aphanomyces invadans]ETW09508.1 hypothetical protein H310_00075 [Aphanomyces invadans]|eukprot:XP_008860919.1 hypothetical protein H310_00075 [Aphanomyces invadans]